MWYVTMELLKGTSINHLGEVRLFLTRYKPKAQCRDIQTSENCVPKGRDIYTEFIEPTWNISTNENIKKDLENSKTLFYK